MSEIKGAYLTRETWARIRLLLDHSLGTFTGQMDGGHGNQIVGWIKITDDDTTYDEDDNPVETDGYTFVYLGKYTYYDPVAQDWAEEGDKVKVVGPNDEELSVGWRYFCTHWGWDGDVADNSTTPSGDFPLDEDGNPVAPIWMPINPTHCQPICVTEDGEQHTKYAQLPTLRDNSDCSEDS
jgi:hypothetical protein